MYITTSNITTNVNTSVTGAANPDYSVDFLISNDFNREYTSASSSDNFQITITDEVTYIAIAGSDYFGKVDSITISGGAGESVNLVGAGEPIMEVYFQGYPSKVVMTFDDSQGRYVADDSAFVSFLNTNAAEVIDYGISYPFDNTPFLEDGTAVFGSYTSTVLWSENFQDSVWDIDNASIDSDAATAPDGSLTASRLNSESTSGSNRAGQSLAVLSDGQKYTASLYAKSDSHDHLRFRCVHNGTTYSAIYDLDAGNTLSFSNWDAVSITDAGSGWFLCEATMTATADVDFDYRTLVTTSSGSNVIGSIFIWGAMFSESSGAGMPYVKTEGEPVSVYLPDAQQMTVGTDTTSIGYATGFGSLSDDSFGYFPVSIVNFSGVVGAGEFVLTASDSSKWAYSLTDSSGDSLVVSADTDATYFPDDSATIVHIFDSPTTNANITFNRGGNTAPITLSYFAAGDSWEVPNSGEMAGYSRPWSNPQIRNRTQVNKGMPTSAIVETTVLSGKLKVDNMLTTDVLNVWAPFQSFAIREGFFIVEDETQADYGYYCYNATTQAVTAHAQTRTLQNAGIGFNCWTGRS